MRIKQILALTILIGLGSCDKEPLGDPDQDPNYDMDETTLTSNGWTKVFSEDFDSDFSQWNMWESGAFNNELQYYSSSTNNLSISDGKLTITAIKQFVTGDTHPWDATQKVFEFSSGRIESKTKYTSNATTPKMRFSARIKLPEGYGMWPAFWSYGDDWPTNGEIDILEARGNEPLEYHTNYFYGTSPNVNLVSGEVATVNSDNSLTEYWHVYEVIWEQNTLTFLFDGEIVDIKSGSYIPGMYEKLQQITLNVAVGGDYFGNPAASSIETGSMKVDWVKAFTSN